MNLSTILPDGRTVDLNTTEGADAYIMCNEKNYCSKIIREASVVRSRLVGGNQIFVETEILYQIYSQLGMSSQVASDEVFAQIPDSELECWFDHFMQLLVTWTTDDTWRSTGDIHPCNHVLFKVTTQMFKHKSPIAVALDTDFLRVLADFLEARSDSGLPHFMIAQHVCKMLSSMTCFHLYHAISKKDRTKETKVASCREKFMRKLESSGILCQFLRCSTLLPSDECTKLDYFIFDEIVKCPRHLKSNFVKGSICGDTVLAILDGTSYACANEKILKYMRSIARLAEEFGKSGVDIVKIQNCYFCQNVIKTGLKLCSRCKITRYCSKECQKAHWKKHKVYCEPYDNKDANHSRNDLFFKHAPDFLIQNYVKIAKEMIEIMKTKNCKRYEIIVHLDYHIGKDGSLVPPALRDPPEFQVVIYRSYFKEGRPGHWCGDKMCKMFKEDMDASLQHQDNRHRLLYFFVRSQKNTAAMHNLDGTILKGHNVFSEDTLQAVRLVFEEDDYIPLFKCFVDNYDSLLQMIRLLNAGSGVFSPGFLRAVNQCPELMSIIQKEHALLQNL